MANRKKQTGLMILLVVVVFLLLIGFYLFQLDPVAFKYQGY